MSGESRSDGRRCLRHRKGSVHWMRIVFLYMPHRINNDGSKANRRNGGYFRESGPTASGDGEGKEQDISISITCERATNSGPLSRNRASWLDSLIRSVNMGGNTQKREKLIFGSGGIQMPSCTPHTPDLHELTRVRLVILTLHILFRTKYE